MTLEISRIILAKMDSMAVSWRKMVSPTLILSLDDFYLSALQGFLLVFLGYLI